MKTLVDKFCEGNLSYILLLLLFLFVLAACEGNRSIDISSVNTDISITENQFSVSGIYDIGVDK